jgi:hypothetical protein
MREFNLGLIIIFIAGAIYGSALTRSAWFTALHISYPKGCK